MTSNQWIIAIVIYAIGILPLTAYFIPTKSNSEQTALQLVQVAVFFALLVGLFTASDW